MTSRLERLRKKLAHSKADALVVSGQNNVYYLTGFWGTEGTVFVSDKRQLFLTDARYSLIAKDVVKDFDIIETRTPLKAIAEIIAADSLETLGFQEDISFSQYRTLTEHFPKQTLVALPRFVEDLRLIKDDSEIAAIRRACQISDQAFLDVLDFIKPNQTTEMAVNHFLDYRMRQLGAEKASFEFIVASGHRSAMPHGLASDKVIKSGESLTLDFGCYYQHYVSDMTRTIHIGQVTDEEREIYAIALRANQALIEKAKAGLSYREVDSIPRDIITQAGYGANFTHGIGHGIGLDIHEYPYFGNFDGKLQAGMVVTDEPGIYLDGKYGVRIEDDLLITENGCEVLTLAPKELIVL